MALVSHQGAAQDPHKIIARDEDRFFTEADPHDTGRSNFAAFLLGGVVIAGGMLAFLYYDTDNVGRGSDITTGSLGRIETQAAPPARNVVVPPRLTPAGEP